MTTQYNRLIFDGDSLLFSAANMASKQLHIASYYSTEIGRFERKSAYYAAVSEHGVLGFSSKLNLPAQFNDYDNITLESSQTIGDIEAAKKWLRSQITKYCKQLSCKNFTFYVAAKSGAMTFRKKRATYQPYKGNRTHTRPIALEPLREWLITQPNVVTVPSSIEVDDIACAEAQKDSASVLISADKDSRQVRNCHVYILDESKQPEWSDPEIVGELYYHTNGKPIGVGWLYLLYQALQGDQVDNIAGLPKYGKIKAYKALSPFSGSPVSYLESVVAVVCQAYYDAYEAGLIKDWQHHSEDEIIPCKQGETLLIENLDLLYMLKDAKDRCPLIKMVQKWYRNKRKELKSTQKEAKND